LESWTVGPSAASGRANAQKPQEPLWARVPFRAGECRFGIGLHAMTM
jgi:hypothetical protein